MAAAGKHLESTGPGKRKFAEIWLVRSRRRRPNSSATSPRSALSLPSCSSSSASSSPLPAPTSPGCCSRVRRRAAERWRCAWRSARAGAGWCSNCLTEGFWIPLLGTAGGTPPDGSARSASSRSVPLPLPLPLEIHPPLRRQARSPTRSPWSWSRRSSAPSRRRCRRRGARKCRRSSSRRRMSPVAAGRCATLLVVGQVAVALVLLVTGLLFLRNLARAQDLDPGFDTAHTLVAQVGFVQSKYTPATGTDWLEAGGRARARFAGVVDSQLCVWCAVDAAQRDDDRLQADDRWRAGRRTGRVPEQLRGARLLQHHGDWRREGARISRDGSPGCAAGDCHQRGVRAALHPAPRSDWRVASVCRGRPRPATWRRSSAVVRNSKYRTLGEEQRPAIYEVFAQRVNQLRVAHVFVRTAEGAGPTTQEVAKVLQQLDPSTSVDVKAMRSALAFAFLPSQVGAVLLGALGVARPDRSPWSASSPSCPTR